MFGRYWLPLGLLTLALSLAPACGMAHKSTTQSANGSGSATSSTNGFFALADLAVPAYISPVAAGDLAKELAENADYYDNQPTASGQSSGTSQAATDCLSTLINGSVFQGNDTGVYLDTNLDIHTCYSSLNSSPNYVVTYTSASYRIYIGFTCAAGGLSSLVGKSLSQISGLAQDAAPCPSGASTLLSESRLEATGTTLDSSNAGSTVAGTVSQSTL